MAIDPRHTLDWRSVFDETGKKRRKAFRGAGRRRIHIGVGESFLYAIACGPYIKVGVSDNPEARLGDLQCANPYPLRIVELWRVAKPRRVDIERHVHTILRSRCVRSEWFEADLGEVRQAVEAALGLRALYETRIGINAETKRHLEFLAQSVPALPPLSAGRA